MNWILRSNNCNSLPKLETNLSANIKSLAGRFLVGSITLKAEDDAVYTIKVRENEYEALKESDIRNLLKEESSSNGMYTLSAPGWRFFRLTADQYHMVANKLGKDNVLKVYESKFQPKEQPSGKLDIEKAYDIISMFLMDLDKKQDASVKEQLWKNVHENLTPLTIDGVIKSLLDVVIKTISEEPKDATAVKTVLDDAEKKMVTYKEFLKDQLDALDIQQAQSGDVKRIPGENLKDLYLIKDNMVEEVNHIIKKILRGEEVIEITLVGDEKIELRKNLQERKYYVRRYKNDAFVEDDYSVDQEKLAEKLSKGVKETTLGTTTRMLDKNVWPKYDTLLDYALKKSWKEGDSDLDFSIIINSYPMSLKLRRLKDGYQVSVYSKDPIFDKEDGILFERTYLDSSVPQHDVGMGKGRVTKEEALFRYVNSQYNYLVNNLKGLESTTIEDKDKTLDTIQRVITESGLEKFNRMAGLVISDVDMIQLSKTLPLDYGQQIDSILSQDHNFSQLQKTVIKSYLKDTQYVKSILESPEWSSQIIAYYDDLESGKFNNNVSQLLKSLVSKIISDDAGVFLNKAQKYAKIITSKSSKWLKKKAEPTSTVEKMPNESDLLLPTEEGVYGYEGDELVPSEPGVLEQLLTQQEPQESKGNIYLGQIYKKLLSDYSTDVDSLLSILAIQNAAKYLRNEGFEATTEFLPRAFNIESNPELKDQLDLVNKNLAKPHHTDSLYSKYLQIYKQILEAIRDMVQ